VWRVQTGHVADCSECYNEPSCQIKVREFCDYLSNCWLLGKLCVPWSLLLVLVWKTALEGIHKPLTVLSGFWKDCHICCYDRGHTDKELYVDFTELHKFTESCMGLV
jgi:hypothetical protein